VVVKDKGATPIKDVILGDMVLSDEQGSYTRFLIGRFDENILTKFLRISTKNSTKPLEVTPEYLIYKSSDMLPVPASSVKVGDALKTISGPSNVTSIEEIFRKGVYTALTVSGTLVVDGVVTADRVVHMYGEYKGAESENDW
jgi:hypothetical protein